MTVDLCPVFEQDGRSYRKYEENPQDRIQARVKKHYYNQHRLQTVDFVNQMHKKWLSFNHAKMPIWKALDVLANFLDESDPDVDDANLTHAYQTAEQLRKAHPDKPCLHLAGLVHDLGKIMSVWGEEQWAVTGDTYPVGCAPSDMIVYGVSSFEGNPDVLDPRYNTKLGMYEDGCGLENLKMCWSHDEYMYQVLVNHGSTIPEEALYAIRFHSFYPYHSHDAYKHFVNAKDLQYLEPLILLNSCDLYSKNDEKPDIEKVKPYYKSLIDKYIPGVVACFGKAPQKKHRRKSTVLLRLVCSLPALSLRLLCSSPTFFCDPWFSRSVTAKQLTLVILQPTSPQKCIDNCKFVLYLKENCFCLILAYDNFPVHLANILGCSAALTLKNAKKGRLVAHNFHLSRTMLHTTYIYGVT